MLYYKQLRWNEYCYRIQMVWNYNFQKSVNRREPFLALFNLCFTLLIIK